ncbi:MAG: M48 family metallopeptidase [Bacteroidia bacterium]|nr:M48 family metallopeptidase [Bacteroidia bacterium]
MPKINYPASPTADTTSLVKVPATYRKHVWGVLSSIFVFIIGYLAMLVLSLALIYYGAKLALAIIMFKPNWITLIAAAGVMIVVIMFFVFIIKFMFKIKKEDAENKVELSREEHPLLFEFIERVCDETKAPKPHKIVVSPAVNASVYYNSSFLSMFFPVRKNLEIGLGLVNSVNITEFKAIIAHEFGHFSQSSTRLGSYVYRFNKMIYNLLYDNEGWSNTLNSITSIHAFLGFFARIAVGMANLALRFFMQLYKLTNISYLSLSREMEFHADSVAVSVTGSKPIISALHRLDFAQQSYNYTLQGIVEFNKEEILYPENFFGLMQHNSRFLAEINYLKLENNLPVITEENTKSLVIEPRIKYKDVWASHPSTADREKNANRIFLESDSMTNSPWELFSSPEKLQREMSRHLAELGAKGNKTRSNQELIQFFESKQKDRSNPLYKDFYLYTGNTFAVPKEENKADVMSLELSDIFNDAIVVKLRMYQQHLHDTEVVKSISEGHLDIKRFEFDGKSYTRYYSADVYKQLQKETETEEELIKQHIQKIADWFYFKKLANDPKTAGEYKALMTLRDKMAQDREPFMNLMKTIGEFYHKELTRDRNMDEVPALRSSLLSFYNTYLVLVGEVKEGVLPSSVLHLFPTGYKAAVFKQNVPNPEKEKNLDGWWDFVNGLEALMQSWAEIDTQVYNMVIKIQDEGLASSNTQPDGIKE